MSRSDQAGKRTESIRVRLEPDMMQRFEQAAARYGLTPSTMAAVVLGEYVVRHERGQEILRDASDDRKGRGE